MQTENYIRMKDEEETLQIPLEIEARQPLRQSPLLTKGFLTWTNTNSQWPEEGIAIVWMSMQGSMIDGVVTYEKVRGSHGVYRDMPRWLPLRSDRFHTADEPIKYQPGLWRYA